jgi:hypothetical protein
MRVVVPTSVDVKGLVRGLNPSQTRYRNLKNKMYYLLSKIVSTNDNYRLNLKNNGYRNLCSVPIKKVLGNRDYYDIIHLLTRPDDPIIQTNKSWSNYQVRDGSCQGYRLTDKYNTGETEFKTIPNRLERMVVRYTPRELDDVEFQRKYQFLFDQFTGHQLTFDPRVYDYIRNLGTELLGRVDENNPYHQRLVYNVIGRMLYYVLKIEQGELWYKVSEENYRLNSNITGLPKTLRPFILCNGEKLVQVDISSSQPYILSSVMERRFFEDTTAGYNLSTIYPELFEELVSKGNVGNGNTDSTGNISFGSSDYTGTVETTNTGYQSNTTNIRTSYSYSYCSSYSFMWCKFFTDTEVESMVRFQKSPFRNDFYTSVINTYKTMTGDTNDFYPDQRQKLKDTMMYIMFDDNKYHRNHNDTMWMFRSVYPGVDKWIREIHQLIGKRKFSYLLQRSESYLILDVVCREFHDLYPEVPVFTVHDAVFTAEEYVPVITRLVLERFKEITGIEVGLKVKYPEMNPEPKPVDVDKIWKKIDRVKTQKGYEKIKNSVFSSNVDLGMKFLDTRNDVPDG